MKRIIKYNSIDQLVNAIYSVKREVQYVGQDDNGEAIYDETIKLPIIEVVGWEKIHGTNATICLSNSDGFWVQSKKHIIVPGKDNAGCAKLAYENEEAWTTLINRLAVAHEIDLDKKIISLYYEHAGKGIEKNTAVKGMEKLSFIFAHFKVSPLEPSYDNNQEEVGAYWLPTVDEMGVNVSSNDHRIFNIRDFKHHKFTFDMNEPKDFVEKVEKLIVELEKNSPVGEQLGSKGNIGEGFVFTFTFNGKVLKFKIKGDEHGKNSGGEKKVLSPEEEARLNKIVTFVNDEACPEWRLSQMYKECFPDGKVEMKNMGFYLTSLYKDIEKEETVKLAEIGLIPKDISKHVSDVGRPYFTSRMNKEAGL